jgi:hypothetical protein
VSRLARAELLLFVLLGLHTVDHAVNQPARTLPAGSGLIGIAGFTLVAVAIVFALWRGRLAAPIGLLAGLGTLAGFVAVHIPGFGPIADPFVDFDPNALSWALLFAPMAASVLVAYVASGMLRSGAEPSSSPAG